MKRLILTRHAKSSWDDPLTPDHDRPLNERGKAAAADLGQWLASRDYIPGEVLCSDALRTRKTFSGIAPALPGTPVLILAAGQGSEAGWGTGPLGAFNMPAEIYCSANTRTLARELYARAGVGPADIDVAQFYDDFTGMVLMSLERYVALERAGAPDLDLLTDRFDELYARMQAPGVIEKSIAALDLQKAGASSPRPAKPRLRRRG